MWVLLHFNRMMTALRRAANRPIGYVDSAVMLNAKLKPGVPLLHVISMTKSLGELLSPKDEQPEIYRWTDGSASHVTCEFQGGKLVRWKLERPTAVADGAARPGAAARGGQARFLGGRRAQGQRAQEGLARDRGPDHPCGRARGAGDGHRAPAAVSARRQCVP
jgi:hypothetical protein